MTRRAPATRPSYRRALQWIIDYDDTEWLEANEDEAAALSVTASLVADLFGHCDEKVARDLRRELKKIRGR